jgi:protoheme IX farnesyltransferase
MAFAALLRPNLSIAVASSALAGCVVTAHALTGGAVVAFCGVLLLSFAASAFNQVQEMRADAAMARTRGRPLPTGSLSRRQALWIGAALCLAGLAILIVGGSLLAGLLGALNLAWYHAVYTPLKRATRYAIFAGAVSGAAPPLIGGALAGDAFSTGAVLLAAFMFVWQIPHFLLVVLAHGSEYEEAGFPSFLSTIGETGLRTTILLGVAAGAGATSLLPLSGAIAGEWMVTALAGIGALSVAFVGIRLALWKTHGSLTAVFRAMHAYQACVLALLVAAGLSN